MRGKSVCDCEGRGQYRVRLDRRTVHKLQLRAVEITMATGRLTTWQQLLGRAAEAEAAKGVGGER
jgi:hypothetical protein